jgi:hypothetical protein
MKIILSLSLSLTILLSTQVLMASEGQVLYSHCYAKKVPTYRYFLGNGYAFGHSYNLVGVRNKTAAEVQQAIEYNRAENKLALRDGAEDFVVDENLVHPLIEQALQNFAELDSVRDYHAFLIRTNTCPQENLDVAK